MPDYTKTIIYKLINYDFPELVYVGSTTNFTKRKQQHKYNALNTNHPCYNYKLYVSIREHGGWESWAMVQICEFPCNNKRDAQQEEDRHMMELKSNLNMIRASRTIKQYREDNKVITKEKNKQYYEDNKDQLKERTIKYNKEHPEKCRVRQKKNYDKMKLEEPEKYKAMLERKRLNSQAKKITQK